MDCYKALIHGLSKVDRQALIVRRMIKKLPTILNDENFVCLTSAIRRMLSTGLILTGVFMDEWSGITTKIGIECLIPDRSSSNCGRDFSTSSPTSFSTNTRMACSNLSERKQRIISSLSSAVRAGASSASSLSMGSGCVSGRSLSHQSLHGPGLDAM